MLIRKANTVEEETTQAMWLYQQCNHMTDGVTVMSLTAPAKADNCGHRMSVLNRVKLKIIT